MGAGCCCAVAILVTVIALIASSFASVDETQYCLRYNTNTRVVEPEPYVTAGSYFIGVTDAFLCFPKSIMNLEFSSDEGAQDSRLTARSQEGLQLDLDLNVEYRLKPDELFPLFEEVGTEFETTFIRIARSELRNVASKFAALEFLGQNRGNISNYMTTLLNTAFLERHAEAIDVQLRTVYLPTDFDDAIRAVEASKLDAKKAIQEREVEVADEDRKNRTAVILLLAERESILLTERTNIIQADLAQEAALTEEQVVADLAQLAVETNRSNIILQATSDIEKATAEREGRLTAKNAQQAEQIIQFETQILEVESEAAIIKLAANATSQAILTEQQALVNAFIEAKNVEIAALASVKAARPDMNSTALLQYKWFEVLAGLKDTLFTVDYQKVPFFLESGGDAGMRSGMRSAQIHDIAGVYDADNDSA